LFKLAINLENFN